MAKMPKDFKYEIIPDDYTQYDLSFKVIVIGDSGVGKSCLTNRATKNMFDENYSTTIGFEFYTFNIKMLGKIVKLQIWDTCGQEIYRSLISNFYRNSSLAIIVYAINSKESFKNIDMWLKELRMNASPDVKVMLIGNKLDLEDERKVSTEEGESYAKRNNFYQFIEASAKTGINTKNTFIEIAYMFYEDYLKYKIEDDEIPKENDKNIKSLKAQNRKKHKRRNQCC